MLNCFTNAGSDLVQRSSPSVASGELRDGGDAAALVITLDDGIEVAFHIGSR